MPRIRCYYADCVFLDDHFCGAASVEIDPDTGCMTYKAPGIEPEEEWEDEADEEWEDEELDEDDDEDFWLDDEDEF